MRLLSVDEAFFPKYYHRDLTSVKQTFAPFSEEDAKHKINGNMQNLTTLYSKYHVNGSFTSQALYCPLRDSAQYSPLGGSGPVPSLYRKG